MFFQSASAAAVGRDSEFDGRRGQKLKVTLTKGDAKGRG